MKEEVENNFVRKYCTISPKDWINLLGSLDARYDSSHAVCDPQKTVVNNKKADQPDWDDTDSELIHRVPHKKLKPNPVKSKQQKISIHRVTQRYCVLCKKSG